MTFKVLVLDAAQRSSLAVTRSLGRIESVMVFTAEACEQALAGRSKFSSGYFVCPSSQSEPQEFLNWIDRLVAQEQFDLVLPVTEITSQLLLLEQERRPHIKLPFAPYAQVMALADKGRLVELAKQVGVPVPESTWFANAQGLDIQKLQYPLVIKPCLSKIFLGNSWLATRVRPVFSMEEFAEELVKSPYLWQQPFMLQEFIPGQGAGIFALYNQGQALAFFAHQRLREKPPEGGVSVLSASAAIDPVLEGYARALLDANQWHGVAMVEFRVADDGTPYLMEINTRFWGSLQLAIDAGVDFPKLLFQTAVATVVDVPGDYRVGQRLRWLLGDFDSLYLYLRGAYSTRQKLRRLAEFLLPTSGVTRYEVNRWGDLGPALHEARLYLRQLLGRA